MDWPPLEMVWGLFVIEPDTCTRGGGGIIDVRPRDTIREIQVKWHTGRSCHQYTKQYPGITLVESDAYRTKGAHWICRLRELPGRLASLIEQGSIQRKISRRKKRKGYREPEEGIKSFLVHHTSHGYNLQSNSSSFQSSAVRGSSSRDNSLTICPFVSPVRIPTIVS